jgi:hypothetical protein
MVTANKEVKQRTKDSHYITKYIKRDYNPSSQKQRKSVLKTIKKVYPVDEDRNCILSYIGSALSWKGTANCVISFRTWFKW